jgi:hypothetical protein
MCVSEAEVKNIVHEEIHQELKPITAEVSKVKTKLDQARNWAVGLLLGLLATMFGIGAWVGAIDNRVTNVEDDQLRFELRIEEKLTRIEDLLLEITRKSNQQ